MSFLKYCVIVPCKKYSKVFDIFLESVLNWYPPPDKIFVATEDQEFPKDPRYEIVDSSEQLILIPENIPEESIRQYRIANAREHLRRHILLKTDYNFVIMIDSDVIIRENYLPVIMFGLMGLLNAQIVLNEFQGKESGYPPPGVTLGSIAFTRQALMAIPFTVFGGWSEDSSYQLLVANSNPTLNLKMIMGKIFKVIHYKDPDNPEESLDPDLELREIRSSLPKQTS